MSKKDNGREPLHEKRIRAPRPFSSPQLSIGIIQKAITGRTSNLEVQVVLLPIELKATVLEDIKKYLILFALFSELLQ